MDKWLSRMTQEQSTRQLVHALEELGSPRILVIGDLILDRYTWGNAERISQEAPVIVLRADRREARLGGASNVCAMLRGLDALVSCAGVVGEDEAGETLCRMLSEDQVDREMVLVDRSRPTTVKERFIGRASARHPNQILRVDSETREPLERRLEDELIRSLQASVAALMMRCSSPTTAKGFVPRACCGPRSKPAGSPACRYWSIRGERMTTASIAV